METQSTDYSDIEICPYESPAYYIAERLKERGYEIADRGGCRRKKPIPGLVGILKEREQIQKSFLGIKWNKNQRALHIGNLLIHDESRGAIEDKKWVLLVYGEEYKPELTKIVKKISIPYQIEIIVKLDKEIPKEEISLFDYLN
ncbi:MAG: hypothetical protein ABIE36_00750 [Candidatus Diapherotrites archaeon]